MNGMVIAWALFGALLGVSAAQTRGFSLAGGIIGGLLLGPLAFLLFFVSGVTAADAQNKKCPHCAEWIKAEATMCKHCHQPTAPTCPQCGKTLHEKAVFCKHCRHNLRTAS